MTDLERFVHESPLADTHSHLAREEDYLRQRPDVLADLFGNYLQSDLVAAGATPAAMARVLDSRDPDISGRFAGIREAWERCRFTGYGQGACLLARLAYGMDEITASSLAEAHREHSGRDRAGERLRLLRDVARLDHVQVDHMTWSNPPDSAAPEFFLYDLSIRDFATGRFDPAELERQAGVPVRDPDSLQEAMAALFARKAPHAIAVKTQHAYDRTLAWSEPDPAAVATILGRKLRGEALAPAEADTLGDWGLDRAIALATAHRLPVKIHTGYLAGNAYMQIDRIRVGQLSPLLARHPRARFVLMHIASGYEHELLALAKHYAHVVVDFCWAWSINPFVAGRFLRACLHQFPCSRLLAFGGDTGTPTAELAYARQARTGIARALSSAVSDADLSEPEAIEVAGRIMRLNAHEVFDVAGVRARLAGAATGDPVAPS